MRLVVRIIVLLLFAAATVAADSDALKQARLAADVGELDRAASLFTALLGAAPEDSDAIIGWCNTAARQGRLEEIGTHFRAQAQREPRSPGAAIGQGLFDDFQGNLESAATHYRNGLELYRERKSDSGEAAGRALLGASLSDLGRVDEAIDELVKALALRRRLGDGVGAGVALTNLGSARLKQGRLSEAKAAYAEARPLFAAAGLRSYETRALIGLGGVQLELGDLAGAEATYLEARPILEARGDAYGIAITLVNLAVTRDRGSRVESALTTAREAIHAAEVAGERGLRARARVVEGNALLARGELSLARAAFENAKVAGADLQDSVVQADAWTGLGNVSREERDSDEAQRAYGSSLELHVKSADAGGQGRDWSNLAAIAEDSNDLGSAVERCERALGFLEQSGDARARSRLLVRLAGLDDLLGKTTKAEERLASAEEISKAVDDRAQIAAVAAERGLRALRAGRAGEAAVFSEDARNRFREVGETRRVAQESINFGEALRALGRWDDAERVYREAGEIYKTIGDRRGSAVALHDLGLVAERRGRLVEAARLLEESSRVQLAAGDIAARAETLTVLGRVLESNGRLVRARETLREAAALEQRLVVSLGGADLAVGFQSARVSPSRELALFLARQGRRFPSREVARSAFVAWQGGRSLALRRLLQAAKSGAIGDDPILGPKWRIAERHVAEARAVLRAVGGSVDASRELVALESAESEVASLLRRWETERLATAPALDIESVESIQARLAPGEALVAYLLADPSSFAWVVRRDDFRQVELASAESIRVEVEALGKSLDPRGPARTSVPDAAARLGALVLQPIADDVTDTQMLWVVPDGALWRVPIDMLASGAGSLSRAEVAHGGEARTLRLATAVLPSAALLPEAPAGLSATTGSGSDRVGVDRRRLATVVVFGDPYFRDAPTAAVATSKWAISDTALLGSHGSFVHDALLVPLPGSAKEVALVRTRYPASELYVRTGRAATEAAFKAAPLARARIVHLATHAVIDRDDPARSSVAFSRADDRREDGILTLQEVLGLRLDGSIVILSACETAGERVAGAEGLQGLARAFLAAGAGAVVASYWPVDDAATPPLMAAFHEALRHGDSAATALWKARRTVLASSDDSLADPRVWGAFVVLGDGRTKLADRR